MPIIYSTGIYYHEGDLLVQSELARILKNVASFGGDYMYSGKWGQNSILGVGPIWTRLYWKIRSHRIYSMPLCPWGRDCGFFHILQDELMMAFGQELKLITLMGNCIGRIPT
jgi:hypothetical protein